MKKYKELAARYLKRQMRRTTLTLIGIILSVSLITGVQIIYTSFMDYMIRDQTKDTNYHGYFFNVSYDNALKIRNYVGIKSATNMENVGLTYIDQGDEKNKAHLITGDAKDVKGLSKLRVKGLDLEGFKRFNIEVVKGRLPVNEGEILISSSEMEILKPIELGATIKIQYGIRVDGKNSLIQEREGADEEKFLATTEKNYKVVGICDNKWPYFSDGNFAYTYLSNNSKGSYIVFTDFKRPSKAYDIANKIDTSFKLSKTPGYYFSGNDGILRLYGGSKNFREGLTLKLLILLMTAIIMVTTISVISNSFNISIIEKSSEYGMLRAIGASPKQIRKLVLREATIMSYIGIPLGILGGFIGMKVLYMIFGLLNYNILRDLSLRIVFKPSIFIISILVSLITIFISAAMPAGRAALVPPVEALKKVDRNIKVKKVKKHRLIKKIFGPEGEIAYKNLSRNRKRLVVTVFSLSLSIMIYIAFDSLFNQVAYVSNARLAKYSYSIEILNSSDVKEINDKLNSIGGVEKTILSVEAQTIVKVPKDKAIKEKLWDNKINEINNKASFITFYNNDFKALDEAYISSLKPYLSGGNIDISELDKGGVLLMQKNIDYQNGNEPTFTEYTNYKPGDLLEIIDGRAKNSNPYEDIENAKPFKTKIIGVIDALPIFNQYPDQGLLMITTEKGMKNLALNSDNYDIYIIKKPNSKGESIIKYLSEIDKQGKVGYINNKEEKTQQDRQMLIVISILVYGFITLIIFISSVNIFNTISSNLYLRKRELGVIKSVGMSQGAMRKMIYLESFYYGMFSIIFGGAAGIGLSFVLYRIFKISQNVQWTVGIKSLFVAAICTIILTSLSTYLPLKKLGTQSIIESIKVE